MIRAVKKIFKRHHIKPGCCAISFNDRGFSIAHLQTQSDKVVLTNSSFVESGSAELADKLAITVAALELQGAECHWVLSPSDYQLILAEAVEVEESELADAARWRIKDMIDFPIAEAAVDAFFIPAHGVGGQRKMMYVVVSHQSPLIATANLIGQSGLNLTKIDIIELALHNLAKRQMIEQRPAAMLYIGKEHSILTLAQNGALFLVRKISIRLSDLNVEQLSVSSLESLALEIQRSFDYYQSQLHLMPPVELIILPVLGDFSLGLSHLQENLSCEVKLLDPTTWLETDADYKRDWLPETWFAIGGALTHAS